MEYNRSIKLVFVIKAAFFLFLLSSCGIKKPYILEEGKKVPMTNTDPSSEVTYLKGEFILTSGEKKRLEDYQDKTLILIFASETCLSCLEETETLLKRLEGTKLSSLSFRILTILEGAILEDALYWKQNLEIPWLVGIEAQANTLHQQYCPGFAIPCTIVQTPDKGILFSKVGKIDIDKDLVPITGEWP